MIPLYYQAIHPDVPAPVRASDDAVGWDFFYPYDETVVIGPGERRTLRLGLAVEIPVGYGLFLFSRSGHGKKFNTRLSNCVGVIDPDYRGELEATLTNDLKTKSYSAEELEFYLPELIIKPMDRVVQGVILRVTDAGWTKRDVLTPTRRGAGGFGSTGR